MRKNISNILKFAAAAMIGIMLATLTPTPAMAAGGQEVRMHVDAMSMDGWEELLQTAAEEGWTIVLFGDNRQEVKRIEPGGEVQAYVPSTVLLHQHPDLASPRQPSQTNMAMHDAILEFFRQNKTTQDLGGFDFGRPPTELGQNLGAELQEIMRNVASEDPLFTDTLGLNDDGLAVLMNSFNVSIGTTVSGGFVGQFSVLARDLEVAANVRSGSRITARTPEEKTRTTIHELGRALGWEEIWCRLLADEAGGIDQSRHGLRWDPSLERAASHAAGGIQMGFEAVAQGKQDAFMDENISNANQHLNFTNEQWQMARTVEDIVRHQRITTMSELTPQQSAQVVRSITSAFTATGRNVGDLTLLQRDIRRVTDHNLPEEQRMFHNVSDRANEVASERINELVKILAQIGLDHELIGLGDVYHGFDRHLAVNINDPEMNVFPLGSTELMNPDLIPEPNNPR